MKKALLIVLISALILAPIAAFTIYAGPAASVGARSYRAYDATVAELTDEQEADLEASFEQMIAIRKETINTMIQDGLLSETQGQLELDRLDAMLENYDGSEDYYGYGMGGCYGAYDTQYQNSGYGRGGMMRYYDRDWD